jgi:hypothetical protein
MLEKRTKISPVGQSSGAVVYIPAKLAADSLFPFKIPSEINVEIDGTKLVISEVKN